MRSLDDLINRAKAISSGEVTETGKMLFADEEVRSWKSENYKSVEEMLEIYRNSPKGLKTGTYESARHAELRKSNKSYREQTDLIYNNRKVSPEQLLEIVRTTGLVRGSYEYGRHLHFIHKKGRYYNETYHKAFLEIKSEKKMLTHNNKM